MSAEREAKVFAALIALADTTVAGFDAVDTADQLATVSGDLMDVQAAGIMLEDRQGSLRVLASSSEEMQLLDLMQLQANEGPCWDAAHTGSIVAEPDLAAATRWPRFRPQALEIGFQAVFAVPLRLRDRTIGALNLFRTEPGELETADMRVAEVLAGMATIGLVSHQLIQHQEALAEQLQTALNSRIIIEQAKGVIAERAGIDVAAAFNVLRKLARSSRRSITDIATDVTTGRHNLDLIPRKRPVPEARTRPGTKR